MRIRAYRTITHDSNDSRVHRYNNKALYDLIDIPEDVIDYMLHSVTALQKASIEDDAEFVEFNILITEFIKLIKDAVK